MFSKLRSNQGTETMARGGTSNGTAGADGFSIAEYVGGYDDWLRQRRVESAPAKARFGVKPTPKPKSKARKLSFKEQSELAEIPARIEFLEDEQRTFLYRRIRSRK